MRAESEKGERTVYLSDRPLCRAFNCAGRKIKTYSVILNFNGGIENMDKTTLKFITVIKNGEVKHIGKSIIRQPEVKFGGGSIKWFDVKQLVKK